MSDHVTKARQDVRAGILAQIAEEQLVVWNLELEQDAKLKIKRLNHDLARPDPYATWSNMSPPAPKPMPGVGEILNYEFRNELGDAELFQKFHEGRYVYDHKAGKWMEYGGVVWEQDAVANAKRVAMTTLPEIYEHGAGMIGAELDAEKEKYEKKLMETEQALLQAVQNEDHEAKEAMEAKKVKLHSDFMSLKKSKSDKRKSLFRRGNDLRGSRRINKVMEVTSSGKGSLGISGEEWEKHPHLFAVANGVVDLRTGKLLESRPGLYLKNSSPYPYIGLMEVSEWWDDHLLKIFCGDYQLLRYFEWTIGYSVTGQRYNKDIYVAYGPQASNGKSATFNAIKDVIGGYATTIKKDVLLDEGKASKGPDPDLMVLDGLRMGIASETGNKDKFSVPMIKAITGGDDVRARGLYADSKIISSVVKLWLHTNDIPNFQGFDPGSF